VTGSVYNASQMPPYELPKYYTRSGVMSRSSKQGSSSNYNEVRLEDKKGDEQLFLHAEKDMDVRVKNDEREFVANNRSLIVEQDQMEKVGGAKHLRVKGNRLLSIDPGGRAVDAVKTMADQNLGSLVVFEDGLPRKSDYRHFGIRAAAGECAAVVVSIFVNPTQFGPHEDLSSYPRDERRDVRLATAAGADLIFAPPVAEIYRPGAATSVRLDGPLATLYEAAERPSHFDGVATIVAKLLSIVGPQRAYFGRKDAQQLAVVRRLTADLDLPVEICGLGTVREPDGLAMSSRNAYLTADERAKAAELHRALLAGRAVAGDGARAIVAPAASTAQPRIAALSAPEKDFFILGLPVCSGVVRNCPLFTTWSA